MAGNWHLARRRPALEARARIVQAIRAFFIAGDFLEVETPQRIPVNAPELHIDAVRSAAWSLHTSPELCLKRRLAAGYPRLFQICRVWRDTERGSRHLPEFTMLEWYRLNAD
jgi:lysyl-tRNA synthetase class 2